MKKSALTVMVLLFVLSISPLPVLAQSSAKLQDIRRLLVLTGSAKIGIQVMGQMLQMQRRSNPEVPNDFWNEIMRVVDPDELIDLIVPIYDRHLSHEDIKGMIRFYESPVGKKLVLVQPLIARDSMSAGQQWGMAIGRKIIQKLQAEGYK